MILYFVNIKIIKFKRGKKEPNIANSFSELLLQEPAIIQKIRTLLKEKNLNT